MDAGLALVAMVMTGALIMELKDAEGKIIKTQPVQHFIENPVIKQMTCAIPMDMVRELMKKDFEINISGVRPAVENGVDTLMIHVKEKQSRIYTDTRLPNSEIEKIKLAARKAARRAH